MSPLLRALPIALLPGCLVSFNDYPLGDIDGRAGINGSGGSASGNTSSGGVAPQGGNEPTAGSMSMNEGGEVSTTGPGSMLDDFEDDDGSIPEIAGRKGSWYTGNDEMGTQTPAMGEQVLPISPEPLRAGSNGAVRTYGGPFAQWGALIGTSLSTGPYYDMSGYQGIRLWVRLGSAAPQIARSVRLNLPSPGTNSGGGICTMCSDHFGADIELTTDWRQRVVLFKDLKQRNFGVPQLPKADLARVTSLQFGFPDKVEFDLWLDDIELF